MKGKWVVRRTLIVCLVLALMVLSACTKEAEETEGGTAVVEESTTALVGVVGDWQMKHRGTDIVSKVTLSLAEDGTFTHLGQRGETVETGTYTYEGGKLSLNGAPCSGSGGQKLDPCVGEYEVTLTEENGRITAITLQLIEDPGLARSLDFGGQEFVRK